MILTLVTFVSFCLVVAVASWALTRNDKLDTVDGYYLGGRSLSAPIIAGSMLLTNLSTEHLVGLNGLAYKSGFIVMAWEVVACVGITAFTLYFLPRYLTMGIATIPDFLERRFNTNTRIIASLLFLCCYVISLLPIVLYTGAIAFESLFEISKHTGLTRLQCLWITVWVVGLLGSVYAIFGGLKAVAVSDTINGIGLLMGGISVPLFGLSHAGNGNIFTGLKAVYKSNPEKFNSIGGEDSVVPFSCLFTGMIISNLFFWCTNQSIIQRALGARNLKEGQKGAILTAFLKLLVPLIVILPGVISAHIFGDGFTVHDRAYPALVHLVLPNYFVGFFAAVVMGSVLSTFNSALNSSITLFCCDIYKGKFYPSVDDKHLVAIGKVVGTILAIFSMVVAPFVAHAAKGLFYLIQQLQGIFNVPILSVVVVGLFTTHVPSVAAILGLILGIVPYVIFVFVVDLKIHFFHLTAILFVVNVLVMLTIGRIWPMERGYVEQDTQQVCTQPWKYAEMCCLIVVTLCISMYIFLAHNVYFLVWMLYTLLLAFNVVFILYTVVTKRKTVLLQSGK